MNESPSEMEIAILALRAAARRSRWQRTMQSAESWAVLPAGVCVGWNLGKWAPDPWSRVAVFVAMVGPMLWAHLLIRRAKRQYEAGERASR